MRSITWVKMIATGGIFCVGGPALVMYLTPTEEELFTRYNPELQRRSLERRQEKQEDFDNFVGRLKEYSKSDKPIWTAWEKDIERRRKEMKDAKVAEDAEAEAKRQEIKGSIK
ncbi:hypothetical protein Q7P37_011272 [Cladosporium fusiforme]